ncbi:hypothetical protein Tco_1083361 [Tanacetum coccineum]
MYTTQRHIRHHEACKFLDKKWCLKFPVIIAQKNHHTEFFEPGEVIEEFRTRDEDLDIGIDGYPILEDMDAYHDKGMGDAIFGEPFLQDFKNYTNEQCNKIPPLLKVSEKDEKNGISHACQKLKGLYKGVLNLGPDYIRDAKMEEWLTRRNISVHEME